MGDLAEVSQAHRAETQRLAATICEAVRADRAMPDEVYSRTCMRGDTEDFALQMAQEICALRAELGEMRAARDEACDVAEEGWAYASAYFRDKWQSDTRIAELRKVGAL